MEGTNEYAQCDFDFGYSQPINAAALKVQFGFYQCPSAPPAVWCDCCGAIPGVEDTSSTNYGGIATHRDDIDWASSFSANQFFIVDDTVETGILHIGRPTTGPNTGLHKIRDVSDGLSNTLMVGESVYNLNDPYIEFGWCYSSIWPSENVLTTGYGINDEYTRRKSSVVSEHPGGANFLFGDGHVQFISESIPQDELIALTTRAGGEVNTYSD